MIHTALASRYRFIATWRFIVPFAKRGLTVLAGAAALALTGLSVAEAAPTTPAAAGHAKVARLCSAPKAGHAACFALRQVSPAEPPG